MGVGESALPDPLSFSSSPQIQIRSSPRSSRLAYVRGAHSPRPGAQISRERRPKCPPKPDSPKAPQRPPSRARNFTNLPRIAPGVGGPRAGGGVARGREGLEGACPGELGSEAGVAPRRKQASCPAHTHLPSGTAGLELRAGGRRAHFLFLPRRTRVARPGAPRPSDGPPCPPGHLRRLPRAKRVLRAARSRAADAWPGSPQGRLPPRRLGRAPKTGYRCGDAPDLLAAKDGRPRGSERDSSRTNERARARPAADTFPLPAGHLFSAPPEGPPREVPEWMVGIGLGRH